MNSESVGKVLCVENPVLDGVQGIFDLEWHLDI